MSHIPPQSSSEEVAQITLDIVTVEDEEDDPNTLAVVGRAQTELQKALTQLEGYQIKPQPRSGADEVARGIDLLLLITVLGASIAAYKDLLTSIFTLISTSIEVLAKRGRIQELQIITNGKTIILHDVSKKTAKELVETVEAQHPGATKLLTSSKAVHVRATVSRKGKHHNS